jgi:poly-gamma-glutamate capsule biosynthesis protein CapA/YwtB (metallophosphatase superfamily)
MRMIMRVCMGLHIVSVRMLSMLLVLGENTILQHLHLGAADPTPINLLDLQASSNIERRGRLHQHLGWNAGVDQSTQEHVAGYSGKAFKIRNPHELSFTT